MSAGQLALSSSTYGYDDNYKPICTAQIAGGGRIFDGGRDRVFEVVPAKSGTLTAAVGYELDGVTPTCSLNIFDPGCWAKIFYARSACASALATSEVACSYSFLSPVDPGTNQLVLSVVQGVPVYLVVDGYDGRYYSYGTFNLHLKLE